MEPLCCCEYENEEGERSHILACCCDCQALDETCDRLVLLLLFLLSSVWVLLLLTVNLLVAAVNTFNTKTHSFKL